MLPKTVKAHGVVTGRTVLLAFENEAAALLARHTLGATVWRVGGIRAADLENTFTSEVLPLVWRLLEHYGMAALNNNGDLFTVDIPVPSRALITQQRAQGLSQESFRNLLLACERIDPASKLYGLHP